MVDAKEAVHQVKRIVSGLNLEAVHVRFLAKGSTSEVWLVETGGRPVVVRLAVPNAGKSVLFEAEAGLRIRLSRLDDRVALPLATHATHPHLVSGALAWCVDSFVGGETLTRGMLPRSLCHDTGEVLAHLHSIPASGFGLLANRRDAVVGQADDLYAGLGTRLQDPWPFQPADLHAHPIADAAPQLLPRLAPYRSRLLSLFEDAACVPVHSDLHERQLHSIEGRLGGLLDFGDAMVAPALCDIGSFVGFHGAAQATWLLEGYTADVQRRAQLLAQAKLWGIVISLHHVSRAVTLKLPDRMRRGIQFLDENLD